MSSSPDRKAYEKAYREANRDKIRAYQAAYRTANAQKKREYDKEYYSLNKEKWKSPGFKSKAKLWWQNLSPERKKEKAKKGYHKHAEKRRADALEYARKNPEKRKACWNRWYAANKEHRDNYAQNYRENNRDYWVEWGKKNRARQLALAKAWRASNPEKVKSAATRRRARLKDGRSPGVTAQEWEHILEFNLYKCAYCGRDNNGKRLERDHIMPLALGGLDEPSNVVPACRSCNARKGPKHPSVWNPTTEQKSILQGMVVKR